MAQNISHIKIQKQMATVKKATPRTMRVEVRLTEKEYKQIERAAKKNEVTMAQYFRDSTLL
jgi:hypothetical protein